MCRWTAQYPPVLRFDSVRVSSILWLVVQPTIWFDGIFIWNLSRSVFIPEKKEISHNEHVALGGTRDELVRFKDVKYRKYKDQKCALNL